MNVLAVDPGKATGFAVWRDGEREVGEAEMMDFLSRAEEWLVAYASSDETVIVCERYVISPATLKMSRQTWSLEIVGALKYLAHKFGARFVLQDAIGTKRVITNDVLRSLGWYERGMDHGRDALRHLAVFLLSAHTIALPESLTE